MYPDKVKKLAPEVDAPSVTPTFGMDPASKNSRIGWLNVNQFEPFLVPETPHRGKSADYPNQGPKVG